MSKNWIQEAVPKSHKGLLHKKLGIKQGEKIPEAVLEEKAHAGGTIGKEAQFALNVKGLGKKKKRRFIP